MNQQIFIAINLPPHIRAAIQETLTSANAGHSEFYADARMVPEHDWHITVLFLGKQPEEAIRAIERITNDVVHRMPIPQLAIQMITTAPPKRPPRMLWATLSAESNELLNTLKTTIEKDLAKNNIHPNGERFDEFNGHVTLARFPKGKRIPEQVITMTSPITFHPESVDCMTSDLKTSGAAYTVISTTPNNVTKDNAI